MEHRSDWPRLGGLKEILSPVGWVVSALMAIGGAWALRSPNAILSGVPFGWILDVGLFLLFLSCLVNGERLVRRARADRDIAVNQAELKRDEAEVERAKLAGELDGARKEAQDQTARALSLAERVERLSEADARQAQQNRHDRAVARIHEGLTYGRALANRNTFTLDDIEAWSARMVKLMRCLRGEIMRDAMDVTSRRWHQDLRADINARINSLLSLLELVGVDDVTQDYDDRESTEWDQLSPGGGARVS